MTLARRVAALERRAAPTGACACRGPGRVQVVHQRDESVRLPPPPICPDCGRPRRRLLVKFTPLPRGERPAPGPAWQAFPTLRAAVLSAAGVP